METKFIDGIRVYTPSEKAPEFIVANLEFDVVQLNLFLEAHANGTGRVRGVMKKSKGGKLYLQLDTYTRDAQAEAPKAVNDFDNIPF